MRCNFLPQLIRLRDQETFFMTTFQTICSIIVIMSTFGLIFAIWLAINRHQEAQVFGLVSSLSLVIFGMCLGISFSYQHESGEFDEKRKVVLSIISNKFEVVCDRTGPDTTSTARPNCVENKGSGPGENATSSMSLPLLATTRHRPDREGGRTPFRKKQLDHLLVGTTRRTTSIVCVFAIHTPHMSDGHHLRDSA